VPLQEAEAYWKSLNYNTASQLVPDGEDAKVFRPEQFILANDSVEQYRTVSREGRRLSQEMEKAHAGRLLGQPPPPPQRTRQLTLPTTLMRR